MIITGMDEDGTLGMVAMKQASAYNFAREEASCVELGPGSRDLPRGSRRVGRGAELARIEGDSGCFDAAGRCSHLAAHRGFVARLDYAMNKVLTDTATELRDNTGARIGGYPSYMATR